VLVADAGCAEALLGRYPDVGVSLGPRVELLIELAASALPSMVPVGRSAGVPPALRYHDPCQLGRGLGVYEAPRRVLARVSGRAPAEFIAHGKGAACSGAGGLLPVTMPDVAGEIASARQGEHQAAGGGEIVTACASSLVALRKAGPAKVSDVVSWVARAVPPFAP
jgi:Fe-S oxidoreductase